MLKKYIQLLTMTLILAFSVASNAVAGAYAVKVNKKNESNYHIKVKTLALKNEQYSFQVKAPMVGKDDEGLQHCWLIICKSHLKPEQQNFRINVWGGSESFSASEFQEYVDEGWALDPKITKILVQVPMQKNDKGLIEFKVSREIIDRSYVYIDYPHAVFDSGGFYTVDLLSYIKESKKTLSNK